MSESHSISTLRQDALAIWQAGVDAVASERLVSRQISTWKGGLTVCGHRWIAKPQSRICVVGAGKAGVGMAVGLVRALGPEWLSRTNGWINVPEDCLEPFDSNHPAADATLASCFSILRGPREIAALRQLPDPGGFYLLGARPAGLNEPTEAGVFGTREILRRVSSLTPDDLCLVLISGGGSALLPAPVEGISLADKQQVTRFLMRSGATIDELNAVRRSLSAVKGGGLLRACRGGRLISLIISDVSGDPLEVIASGPTVNVKSDPQRALEVLNQFLERSGDSAAVPAAVFEVLTHQRNQQQARGTKSSPVRSEFENCIIGNNRTAVTAAAGEAVRRGYHVAETEWDKSGDAAQTGRELSQRLLRISKTPTPGNRIAIVSGGEPTVQLSRHSGEQKGGRNQELVLAAAAEFLKLPDTSIPRIALVSGGTDGEDGPTDAAGAVIDRVILEEIRSTQVRPDEFLQANNSYPFLDRFGALVKTGPTHTNVMDLRVGLIDREC
ncbi:glycerate kinase type-2 family protein [Planctomicrobium sp. SH664]|uniref:glycerate kinase type-2 family protein n=1 Tax=Planctomicrobium sp. SH664 TaxID=3448125 RepID=UPI003F5C9AED